MIYKYLARKRKSLSRQLKYLIKMIRYPEYLGSKRHCNLCGFRFAKFASFNGRNEARCPVCGSLERHRHLYILLLPLLPFLKGRRILHFAPEPAIKNFFRYSEADYYDADLAKNKASYQTDITNINFDDAFFDYCVASHVLEHIVDDMKAFTELYRVLKPGGIAFLAVPVQTEAFEDYSITTREGRTKAFGKSDHVRWYSQDLFEERIRSAGFSIQHSVPSNFPEELRNAYMFSDALDTFVIAKK